MIKKSWLMLVLAALATPVLSMSGDTHEYLLDNGLKLVVREDHRAPVIASMVWYRVGSSYEPAGITGVSHVLEHMMFKGTKKIAPGEFSKIVSRYGGQDNAFTARDYTGYFQQFETSRLPLSFEMEADRMENLILLEEEFVKEIKVVMEERRLRTDDNPNAKAYERFMAAAYVTSSYRQPVIGWMHELETLSVNDLARWYQKWYAPNNATLVVVGDVEPDAVFSLAKKYFGKIKSRALPKVALPREIASLGERRLEVKVPAQLPALYMGFNVPSLNTAEEKWEVYALEMLAGVLDGGYSARIEKDLIRKRQIAASASAGYSSLSRGDTLFMLSGVPAANHTLEEVEVALFEEINKLKESLADKEEIKRVQAQIISALVYKKDSLYGQANTIGQLESRGYGWKTSEQLIEKLKSVTPEQIQSVAKKYLIRERLTVAQLIPQSL